jgi:hypothetical protein
MSVFNHLLRGDDRYGISEFEMDFYSVCAEAKILRFGVVRRKWSHDLPVPNLTVPYGVSQAQETNLRQLV